MNNSKLQTVEDFMQAVYDTGYYAGKAEMSGEFGSPDQVRFYTNLNIEAIRVRSEAKKKLLQLIDKGE